MQQAVDEIKEYTEQSRDLKKLIGLKKKSPNDTN